MYLLWKDAIRKSYVIYQMVLVSWLCSALIEFCSMLWYWWLANSKGIYPTKNLLQLPPEVLFWKNGEESDSWLALDYLEVSIIMMSVWSSVPVFCGRRRNGSDSNQWRTSTAWCSRKDISCTWTRWQLMKEKLQQSAKSSIKLRSVTVVDKLYT